MNDLPTAQEVLKVLADNFEVIDGPNAATSQYGHLELYYTGGPDWPNNGDMRMKLGDAGNSYWLAAMGQLQGIIAQAKRLTS